MRKLRVALFLALGVAAALPAASSAGTLAAPGGLRAFELRAGDTKAAAPSFSRTPAFAWNPVRGAVRYQFQLSASSAFSPANAVVWSGKPVITPATAVPIALPWTGGRPLYWRVRAFGADAVSRWSEAARFRLQGAAPSRLPSGAGYVRWSPVAGASGYEVLFRNVGKVVATTTTVADLRDYAGAGAPHKVVWRVRAVRRLLGSDRRTLPAVSHGPWSRTYASRVSPRAPKRLTAVFAGGHARMPVFLFPRRAGLHRVYVAKDPACTRVVLRGPAMRGAAFAPRAGAGAVSLANGRYWWTAVAVARKGAALRDLADPQAGCRSASATFVRGGAGPKLGSTLAPFATGLSPSGRVSSRPRFYGPPVVAWQPVAGATRYDVQWSRTDDPWHTVGSAQTYATAVTLPVGPGTWWYRVRGIDGSVKRNPWLSWSNPARVSMAAPTFTVVEG
jgi:hypothetical protein